MIRVLHLIKGLGPGGAEQLLVNQAAATDSELFEFQVGYLVAWKNHNVEALRQAGWETACLGSDRSWDLRYIPRLWRMLWRGNFDVLHGHSPLVASISRLLLRLLPPSRRPRSIYTEHNEWGRHRLPTRLLNGLTIGLEDKVLAVSDGVRASMPKRLDVEVLIHGIDVEAVSSQRAHRREVREELGIASDEIVIGTVANFRREKAYEVLLEAAATVVAGRPDVRFVSVGQGPLEAEVRAHHARLELGERFLLLGYRDDATRVMSAFDVFTLASRHEGLPVSLMDAMALSLPVVSTAVGGIPAAVRDWPAILVEPDDPVALAGSFSAMIDRPDMASAPARTERFDSRRAADALIAHYTEAASDSRGK